MRSIAVLNQKGGVGKTTSSVNLSAALAAAGNRVCLIDLDPQAHASLHLGWNPAEQTQSIYEVLVGDVSLASVRRQVAENLWLVGSHIDLAAAEVELVGVVGRESILRDKLADDVLTPLGNRSGQFAAAAGASPAEPSPLGRGQGEGASNSANHPHPGRLPEGEGEIVKQAIETDGPTILSTGDWKPTAESTEPFDYLLIDCPPSLGILTLNALAAVDEVLLPLQPHFLALHGLSKLLQTIDLVSRRLNPRLTLAGVVLCQYESATRLAGEVASDVREFFEHQRSKATPWQAAKIFQTRIRRNIRLAEAPSFGQSIFQYAAESAGAEDYRKLAVELAQTASAKLAPAKSA